jgi:purine-nucleoside phosphorylase
VEAAIGATRVFAQRSPSAAVLVGTAGAYGSLPIGSVVVSRRLGLGYAAVPMDLGYVPRTPEVFESPAWMREAAGVAEADILTVGAITTSPGLVETWSASWQVEHMEAWSVARVAQEAGVPFVAVLGISNRVGPDAHAEWLAHRGTAEAAAREVVARLIASPVPGSPG